MSAAELITAAGAGVVAGGGVLAMLRGRWRLGLAVQAAGMTLIGAAGAAVFLGAPAWGAPFRSGFTPALGVDGLSGFFLAVLALIAVPALIYGRDALAGVRPAPVIAVLTGGFCLALVGLLVARDAASFLAFW